MSSEQWVVGGGIKTTIPDQPSPHLLPHPTSPHHPSLHGTPPLNDLTTPPTSPLHDVTAPHLEHMPFAWGGWHERRHFSTFEAAMAA